MENMNSLIRHLLEGGSSLVERMVSRGVSTKRTVDEDRIERSKPHWSELAEDDSSDEEEVAEESNVEVFDALQRHVMFSDFFRTFDGGEGANYSGELVVGKKFAEGGQAELYEVQVQHCNPKDTENDLRLGREYVLKVFKKGTRLKHLKSQFSQGLLHAYVEGIQNLYSPTSKVLPQYYCHVHGATLLKDGRFAFWMQKEHLDLSTLIEQSMRWGLGGYCGPFSRREAEFMMYRVGLGVDWLHSRGIVHRDLKAANVLVRTSKMEGLRDWIRKVFLFIRKPNPGMFRICFIADYECSIGVVGTGFFRAPEILQACKEGKIEERLDVFSKAADIFSYGMTCYEILVGKLPFQDHPFNNKLTLIDRVIDQHLRPEVPRYVEAWTHELLSRCWQSDPAARPLIGEVLDIFSGNSAEARNYEKYLKREYGDNFRSNFKQD